MVVSLVNKTGLVIICILIIGTLSLSCASIKPAKYELIGKWVMTNQSQDSYHLHDTIEFQNNRVFISTTVPNTENTGKWTFRQGNIKLKSCLHRQTTHTNVETLSGIGRLLSLVAIK